ncbi:hypothetical protein IQ275_19550 [Nostoc sp. LEGE 12450]|nr:hypothetical protein [Nostoc sp. LEGE 12450]
MWFQNWLVCSFIPRCLQFATPKDSAPRFLKASKEDKATVQSAAKKAQRAAAPPAPKKGKSKATSQDNTSVPRPKPKPKLKTGE